MLFTIAYLIPQHRAYTSSELHAAHVGNYLGISSSIATMIQLCSGFERGWKEEML
jgi:hypothetical protein